MRRDVHKRAVGGVHAVVEKSAYAPKQGEFIQNFGVSGKGINVAVRPKALNELRVMPRKSQRTNGLGLYFVGNLGREVADGVR